MEADASHDAPAQLAWRVSSDVIGRVVHEQALTRAGEVLVDGPIGLRIRADLS